MLISELIKELQSHKAAYGDEEVVVYDDDTGGLYVIQDISNDGYDADCMITISRYEEDDDDG